MIRCEEIVHVQAESIVAREAICEGKMMRACTGIYMLDRIWLMLPHYPSTWSEVSLILRDCKELCTEDYQEAIKEYAEL